MGKKCEVTEINQWNLEGIRVIIAQSVCYMLAKSAEALIGK